MFGQLLDQIDVDNAITTLVNAPRVILVTHEHPDGDAVGSTLALARALTLLGKNVVTVCKDPVPLPFQFLQGAEDFAQSLNLMLGDVVITIDCGDLARTGFIDQLRAIGGVRGRVINIDHHQRNDLHKVARLNLVNGEASSAAELVFELVGALGVKIDKALATDLLTGIYTDTGGFRHSNTTPQVLEIASRLMLAGGRLRDITKNIANFRSVTALRLWGVALERIRYHEQLGLVASVITRADLVACQALPEDIAGAVNLINHVPEAKVAILCTEPTQGIIKASLRTESNIVDVARLANIFGGGGLKKAAGFAIHGSIHVDSNNAWHIMAEDSSAFNEIFSVDLEPRTVIREVIVA